MYFTSGRIKKCLRCVDPRRATVAPNYLPRKIEVTDEGWYPEAFRTTWHEILANFTVEQRLLFEVVIADRRRTEVFLMQSTDIVNRVPQNEIDIELGTYSKARIIAARGRLARQLESERSRL